MSSPPALLFLTHRFGSKIFMLFVTSCVSDLRDRGMLRVKTPFTWYILRIGTKEVITARSHTYPTDDFATAVVVLAF